MIVPALRAALGEKRMSVAQTRAARRKLIQRFPAPPKKSDELKKRKGK